MQSCGSRALKVNINGGPAGLSTGFDVSVGLPQGSGISARVQGGLTYHFGNNYNNYSGWEGRYGYELGVGKFRSAANYNDFEGSKFDQRTNQISIGSPIFNVKYENDYMFGLPADGGDRYRTAALKLTMGYVNAGFNLYTGDPGLDDNRDRQRESINGQLTYVRNEKGDDPDKYRFGALYVGVGGIRIGRNSERNRNLIQNEIAHDRLIYWFTGEKSPHFAVDKSKKPKWYWNFGTGTGNSLW